MSYSVVPITCMRRFKPVWSFAGATSVTTTVVGSSGSVPEPSVSSVSGNEVPLSKEAWKTHESAAFSRLRAIMLTDTL